MDKEIAKLWKDFRYSYTKNPKCMLTNRELFNLFKASVKGVIFSIEASESF